MAAATQVNTNGLDNAWTYPMGLGTPAATVAMQARRYMHEYGATSEDFGRVAVADRRHAATNPHAFFYGKPITLEDHQASRMIVDPLHLLDCCQETDGAVALVVVSAERARDLRAAAGGASPPRRRAAARDQFVMTSYYRDDIGIPEMGVVGRELWRQSGLGPDDMPMAILYDHFTPYVLMQLEELGFCGRGEAPGFIADGAIEVGGRLPLNTHGGQLGEAYIHGMNGIAEAVRQIRGTSVNPVADVEHVLVTAGTGVPTSGLVLRVAPTAVDLAGRVYEAGRSWRAKNPSTRSTPSCWRCSVTSSGRLPSNSTRMKRVADLLGEGVEAGADGRVLAVAQAEHLAAAGGPVLDRGEVGGGEVEVARPLPARPRTAATAGPAPARRPSRRPSSPARSRR